MDVPRRGAAVLAGFVALAFALHRAAGLVFPVPWVDELDFMAPAQALAHHGTLRVPALSAPSGIFWVSDVYYFVLAPVLRFFPATVTVGRSVSFVAIVVAGWGFWTAGRRVGVRSVTAAVVVGLWLVAPQVVIAANVTRHEAVVLACVAWGLAAAFSGRRVAAGSLALLAAMVHPAGAAFALVLAVALALLPAKRTSRWEWGGAAAVAAVLGFEAVHFGANWSVAAEHLRFQIERKADRTSPPHDLGFILAYLAALGVAMRTRDTVYRHAALLVAIGTGGCVVSAFGHEMWYGVYGLSTGALFFAFAALVVAPKIEFALPRRSVELVAATTAVLAVFSHTGLDPSFYNMRISDDPAEWPTFVERIERQLASLDAAASAPTTVAIGEYADLPWPLVDPGFKHLELVKETTVTAADGAAYELVCCATNLPALHPPGEVVATIRSPDGVFDARLVQIRPVTNQQVPSASS